MAAAVAALEPVRHEWMQRSGVVGVDVGFMRRQGIPTSEVGIRVTVRKKLPAHLVPEGELFPRELDGIPVQIREGSFAPEHEGGSHETTGEG